jgi:hypothetical protein
MLCEFFLLAESTALLVLGRGWWRLLAALPALAGFWAVYVGQEILGARASFTFICHNFPEQPPGGWVTSSPGLRAALESQGNAVMLLTGALLALCVALLIFQHRKALRVREG